MTYLALLLVCLLPPVGLLAWHAGTRNSRPQAGERHQLIVLAAVVALAVLATLPWDAALIARGTWSYPRARPVGWVAGVPAEELLFMVLQPLLCRAVAADPVTRPVGPAATEPSRLRPGSWSRALAARRRSGHAAGKVSLGHLPGAAAGLVRSAARAAVGGRRRHAVGSASAPHRGRRSPDPLPVRGGPARPAPTAVAALRLPHHRGAPARPAPRGSPILPAHHSAGRRRAAARDRPGHPGPTPVQAPAGPAPQPKARARRSGPERRPLHDEPATRSTGPGRSSSGTAAPPTAAASGGCARARDGARRSRFRRPSPSGSAKPRSCRATPQQHRHRTLDTPTEPERATTGDPADPAASSLRFGRVGSPATARGRSRPAVVAVGFTATRPPRPGATLPSSGDRRREKRT